MPTLTPILTQFGGILYTIALWGLILTPVIAIIIFVIMKIREKIIYKHPVRIFKVRENNKIKEVNGKGGFINRKNSAPFFQIKLGPFKKIKMISTPNPAMMDEEDRVYFKQIDVDTYVQMSRAFPINPGDEIKYNPVESDIKYGAVLSVQRIKEVLSQQSLWQKVAPFATLLMLGIIFIIAYALLIKAKCPV